MRKLTGEDLSNIAGTTLSGYHVEGVRIKHGECSDNSVYGIILGKNANDRYVTWQFHLDDENKPVVYWGHYFMENREAALQDFNIRDKDN